MPMALFIAALSPPDPPLDNPVKLGQEERCNSDLSILCRNLREMLYFIHRLPRWILCQGLVVFERSLPGVRPSG